MFNKFIWFTKQDFFDSLIKILLSVVFLCIVCPVKFNIQNEVPITLQSFAVILVAMCFGGQVARSAVLIYIIAGAVGLPVFAGYKSGVEVVTGATGGFIISFLVAAVITGWLIEKPWFQKPIGNLVLWFMGHGIILFIGTIWISFFAPDYMSIIIPVLPGAVIKSIVGWGLIQLFVQLTKGRKAE